MVNTYVPNSGIKLDRLDYRTQTWDEKLRSHLAELRKKHPKGHVVWTGDLNVAHRDCDVKDPQKKRNKTPGFCDGERENFGLVVGGSGPISEAAKAKRTALVGTPGPVSADLHMDWRDLWLHHGPEKELKRGYTFWGYRGNSKQKDNGWRLDYFVASPEAAGHVRSMTRREDAYGVSDHIPINLLLLF